jgi:hypothetical protein
MTRTMDAMIRRRLAHISPEELILVPIVIVILIAVLAQPSSITRLFESPYATPAPGEAPAERFLREREENPVPTATPASAPVERIQLGSTPLQFVPASVFSTGGCPGTWMRYERVSASGEHVLMCVDTDGTVRAAVPARPAASPGSAPRPRILIVPSSASGR